MELRDLALQWAVTKSVDEDRAAGFRRQALLANHLHYRRHIPIYERMCEVAGVTGSPDLDTIKRELMLPDDIFKSYPAGLLDNGDFAGMNAWLNTISDLELPAPPELDGIDAWINWLADREVHLVFSSGTSGHMSFVPRHSSSWEAFLELPYSYIPGLLGHRGVLGPWKNAALHIASRFVGAGRLTTLVREHGLREFDGFFLNFSGGNQGIQLVGQETAKLTGAAEFLYDRPMSASAVRAIVRGPRTVDEERLVAEFLETTVDAKAEHYGRVCDALERSVRRGRKVMLFGTPYLLKELCEWRAAHSGPLKLRAGSQVTFGGGWKSFDGSAIPREELLALIGNTFALSRSAILEGYSMTEIHGLMLRCSEDRYHVPPFLETVIFDEELNVVEGPDVTGTLGVLDPFARSYPGFLITGDNVRMVDAPCGCGFSGRAILEIARSPGKEVKGCGGIMATVNA